MHSTEYTLFFFLQLRLATSWCLHMSIVMFASLFRFASMAQPTPQGAFRQPCTSPTFQCLSNEPLILFQFLSWHAPCSLWAGVCIGHKWHTVCEPRTWHHVPICFANMLCPKPSHLYMSVGLAKRFHRTEQPPLVITNTRLPVASIWFLPRFIMHCNA